MTDPLIVVEGTLRLPSLRPLADRPLAFGQEWRPAQSRPAQSHSEFALYAARFFTEYVRTLGLSDVRAPYRAKSIWGVMTERPSSLPRQRKLEAMPTPDAAPIAPPNVAPNVSPKPAQPNAQPDPLNLKVKAPVTLEHAFSSRISMPVKSAIAVACAALFAWLIFDHEPSVKDGPAASKDADANKGQAAEPAQVAAASSSAAASANAAASEPAIVVASEKPAPVPPIPAVSATASNSATTAATATTATVTQIATDKPLEPAKTATPAASSRESRLMRSGVVQSAALDTRGSAASKQKAKDKRDAKRLAAEQKASAKHMASAQDSDARTNAERVEPVATRVARTARDDWKDASLSASARTPKSRIDSESLYPTTTRGDWDAGPVTGPARAPKTRIDAESLYPSMPTSRGMQSAQAAQNDADDARSFTRTRLDAATLYPAPTRGARSQMPAQMQTQTQFDWDNASPYPRAMPRSRADAASVSTAPTRIAQVEREIAPTYSTYSAYPAYPSAPGTRSASDARTYSAPSYAASTRVAASAAAAASSSSPYARTLRSSARYAATSAKAGASMDVKTLYDMLQHSPTLDDNINGSVRGGGNASAR